jgi:hypothetical protein
MATFKDLTRAIAIFHNVKNVKKVNVDKNNIYQIHEYGSVANRFEYKLENLLDTDQVTQSWFSNPIPDYKLQATHFRTEWFTETSGWFLGEFTHDTRNNWESGYVLNGETIYTVTTRVLIQTNLPTDKGIYCSIPYRVIRILEILKIKEFKLYFDASEQEIYVYTDNLSLRYSQDNSLNLSKIENFKSNLENFKKNKKNESGTFRFTKKVPKKTIDEIHSIIKKRTPVPLKDSENALILHHDDEGIYTLYVQLFETVHKMDYLYSTNVPSIGIDIRYLRILSEYITIINAETVNESDYKFSTYHGNYGRFKYWIAGLRISKHTHKMGE